MEIDPIKRVEFYRELYNNELSRSENLNRMIQFPTTVIVVMIPTAFYVIKTYINLEKIKWFTYNELPFQISTGLFCLFTFFAVLALGAAFHGQNRRYLHLPFIADLKSRESELYKHYYKHYLYTKNSDKRSKSKKNAQDAFIEELVNHYVECGDHNMKLNHKRSAYLFTTRVFILLSLIMVLIMGILLLYKQSL